MRTHWDKLQIERAPFNPHLHWRRQNLSCFCSILNLWGITWILVVVKKRRLVIFWVKTVKVVGLGKVNIFCSILMHAWDWIPTLFSSKIGFFNNHNLWKNIKKHYSHFLLFAQLSLILHTFSEFFLIQLSHRKLHRCFVCSTIDQSLTFHEVECTYFFLLRFVIIIYNIHFYMGCRFYKFCVGCVCGFFLV